MRIVVTMTASGVKQIRIHFTAGARIFGIFRFGCRNMRSNGLIHQGGKQDIFFRPHHVQMILKRNTKFLVRKIVSDQILDQWGVDSTRTRISLTFPQRNCQKFLAPSG